MSEILGVSSDKVDSEGIIIANPEAVEPTDRSYSESPEPEVNEVTWYQKAFEHRFPQETKNQREKIQSLSAGLEEILVLYEQVKKDEKPNYDSDAEGSGDKERTDELLIDEKLLVRFQRIISDIGQLQKTYGFLSDAGRENFLAGKNPIRDYLFVAGKLANLRPTDAIGKASEYAKPGNSVPGKIGILTSKSKRRVIAEKMDSYPCTGMRADNGEYTDDEELAFRLALRFKTPKGFDKGYFIDEMNKATDLDSFIDNFNSHLQELIDDGVKKEGEELNRQVESFLDNIPTEWEDFSKQRESILELIGQYKIRQKDQVESMFSQPVLKQLNTIIALRTGDKIVHEDADATSIKRSDDSAISSYKFRIDRSQNHGIDIEAQKLSLDGYINNKTDRLKDKISTEVFFRKQVENKALGVLKEFDRDGLCLAWQEDDFDKYEKLFQRSSKNGLIPNSMSPEKVLEARSEYIENCQSLSQLLFVHNSHHFYLQQFIENGFMSNTAGSIKQYGGRTRTLSDTGNNLAIFFQALNPETMKSGEGWFQYSLPINEDALPSKLKAKKPVKHTEICGVFFDVNGISENMFGEGHPCLTAGSLGIEMMCAKRRDNNDPEEIALAVSSDFTAHRQWEPDLATYVNLTQTPEHYFPAIIYASEHDKAKILASAKDAGWGCDEKGNFDKKLFDELAERNFIFYPKEWARGKNEPDGPLHENYHKIASEAVEKIRKYHGGFKKGIYLSHGNGKNFGSKVSFKNAEIPDQMDKFEWVALE